MANSQDILLTYRTDTGEVTKSLDEIVSGLSEVDQKLDDSAKKTSKVGKGLRAAGRLGAAGFKALGTAIAATGIGALIGLIAGLTAKMSENKKIAEAFEVVVSAIGAAFNILVQRIEPFAGAVVDAFSNPVESIKKLGDAIKNNIQTRIEGLLEFIPAIGKAIKLVFEGEWAEAGKVAADAAGKVVLGVEDITDKVAEAAEAVTEFASDYKEEVTKAVAASTSLTKQQQRLRDQQRDLNVEYAQARAEIEQLKLKRDDERLSIQERIAAAEEAAAKDSEFAQKRMDIANAEVALIEREIALQGDSIERQDRLAEAKIAAAEAAESSAAVQTELMTSIAGLQNEELARQQELIDKERERIDGIISRQSQIDDIVEAGMNREIEKIREKYRIQQEDAIANNQILVNQEEAMQIEIDAIRDKYAKADNIREQEKLQKNLQMASNALGALMALNEAFAGESEAEQKRAFERNKKFQIGQAIIQTAMAVTGALTAGGNPIKLATGAQFVEAAIALATGVAQVATIKKTKFGGGETGGSNVPRPTTPGAVGGGGPQLDLGFLGGGAGQTGFRTYVVSSEVSNAQQANQRINDQATLVG
jgi:hypothetical protein